MSAVFIAICMVVIAGSFGAVTYLTLGLSAPAAGGTAFGILSLLAAFHAFTTRLSGHAHLSHQLAELSRGTTDLARQVGELGRRVVAVEAVVADGVEQARAAADPLAAELDLLGTLVKDLAESVAAHEAVLGGTRPRLEPPPLQPAPAPAPAKPAALTAAPPAVAPPHPAPVRRAPPPGLSVPAAAVPAAPAAEPLDEVLAALETAYPAGDETVALANELRAAVENNRIDFHLQPIVTLPQRRPRHYEAIAYLRLEDGVLQSPADYRAAAEATGLIAVIDQVSLARAVQVARRLAGKNREVAVFCEIAVHTLADPNAFSQLHELLSANRPLAPSLVLGLAQADWRGTGPIEQESLAQIASLGFRFALTAATDLRLDARQLGAQGFRFIKIPAAALLDRNAAATVDIHPSDLSNLLSRFSIELIADRVDTEGTVVDLLDYDVGLGQGMLFGPPRAVRMDLFQGATADGASPSLVAPQIAGRPIDGARRRESEPVAPLRSEGDRSPQGLVKLARNMMRRA